MTQREALDILKLGHNVFLTGPAGSGKTFLLNKYIEYLKDKKVKVGITASTGIAATHINGRTIHSWSGFGIKDKLIEKEMRKLLNSRHLNLRISATKVLIIDEISMLHAHQLDLVNRICKKIRNNYLPFGGLQVVLCGDFFQLSPVERSGKKPHFVNESKAWLEMGIKVCYLDKCQHRHKDENFIKLLNEIRKNNVSVSSKKLLLERLYKSVNTPIKPVKLHTHNANVDAINSFELKKIKTKERVYEMTSDGPKNLVDSLKKWCLAPEGLTVKKGAAVIFVKNNFDRGYINGTLGKIVGFNKEDGYPVVKVVSGKRIPAYPESWKIEEDDEVKAQISQIPLRLAWAITVHKSQGMTLDIAEMDLSKSFDYGMGYVALSRVRSFNGIKLIGVNRLALQVSKEVIELDKYLQKMSEKVEKSLGDISVKEIRKRQKSFVELNTDEDESEEDEAIPTVDIAEDEIPIVDIPF
ncbi:MAG: PIF1 family DEAD/DEAH box helicase [Candidatus Nealsonbacteria bacterium]